MHPETPRLDLRGLTQMTHVMAFCAKQSLDGGAYGFR